MNAQIFRPQVIEALTVLWRALPPRGVTDEQGTMEDYCFALSDCSAEAVFNTVNNLRSGKIEEASKSFCPKPPELAVFVRSEQSRLDAVNRPRSISYQPASRPWKDWNIIQRERTRDLATKGFVLLGSDIDHATASSRMRQKRYPVGSIWFWAIQEIWGKPA